MTESKKSGSANLGVLKNKLLEEFENMSRLIQDEKNNFEEQMTRKKNEFDAKIKEKLAELDTERKALDHAKLQLQQQGANFAQEMGQKTQNLERLREEFEQEKKEFLQKAKEERAKAKIEEVKKLKEVEAKAKEYEIENEKLISQKLDIEKEVKNLKQAFKKEEEQHFQKMAALKKELEEIEDEIEQKLFFTVDQAPDYTKESRELIIKTVAGDIYRGKINIGSKERLSDMFTKVKIPFIVMYDVVFKGEERATVIVNKQNIVSIKPLDGSASGIAANEKGEKEETAHVVQYK
jgi:DNA repair exonuclease SbcCD ATPase subunit